MAAIDSVRNYCSSNGLKYDESNGVLILRWNGTPCDFAQLVASSDMQYFGGEKIEVVTTPDIHVPTDQMWSVLDLLNRRNRDIALGKWWLDFSDGQLGFQAMAPIVGKIPEKEVEFVMMSGNVEMQTVMPAVMNIMYGGKSGPEAYATIE